MPRFKVKLKIENFELEMDGNREDVPLIANNIGQQLAGMLQPVKQIISGARVIDPEIEKIEGLPSVDRNTRKNGRKKSGVKTDISVKEQAVDWIHNPTKWGAPQQSWNTANKSIWLLYVAEQETGKTEMSAIVIAATFNKHFRQAKPIQVGNVSRDLGKLKTKTNATVAEDTTKSPSTWFLTDAGKKKAAALIAETLGQATEKQG
jgi:hypothetical protein